MAVIGSEQPKVRFLFTLRPSRGRGSDLIRRASRLADATVECGAFTSNLRRITAGFGRPNVCVRVISGRIR
jgi:hypothetical protein